MSLNLDFHSLLIRDRIYKLNLSNVNRTHCEVSRFFGLFDARQVSLNMRDNESSTGSTI